MRADRYRDKKTEVILKDRDEKFELDSTEKLD